MKNFDMDGIVQVPSNCANSRNGAVSWWVLCSACAALALAPQPSPAAETDGVALAIIYDTSGSMGQTVPDKNGRRVPKYIIANRALMAIARELESFATNTAGGAPRSIQAGLFTFHQRAAKQVVPFGPLNAAAIIEWAKGFSDPHGDTPLGNALRAAGQTVLNSPLSRKHVLVITDGINTSGPPPEEVLPRLKDRAEQAHTALSVHFIAFDVDAAVFAPVKKLGATVVGAADEKQLESQLQFIMQRKILLEEEEPKPK
ncbi:exported hypothetical protein [Verrucomicrobia bacterium]|nr:exported hypothetical protein [Verrucomicrobiota bacterium]